MGYCSGPFRKSVFLKVLSPHEDISGVKALERPVPYTKSVEYSMIKAHHLTSLSILSKILTIQSHDFLDHIVTFLIVTNRKFSFSQTGVFFTHLIIFETVCSKKLHLSVLSQYVQNLG